MPRTRVARLRWLLLSLSAPSDAALQASLAE